MWGVESHRGGASLSAEWASAATMVTLLVGMLSTSCGTTSNAATASATTESAGDAATPGAVATAFPPEELLTPAHVDVRRKECADGQAQSCRLLGLVLLRLGRHDAASAAFARGCRGGASKACVEWGDTAHGAALDEANQRGCALDEARACVRFALHTDDVKVAQHARRKACRLDAVTCAQISVQALNEEMTLLRNGRPSAHDIPVLSQRCDRGDGAACFQLASWNLDSSPAQRFHQACGLGLEAGCARAAEGGAPALVSTQCGYGFSRACALERLQSGAFDDATLSDICRSGELAACTWLGFRQRYGLNTTVVAPLAAKETWSFACRHGAELACHQLQSWFGRYQSGAVGRLLSGATRLTGGKARGLRRPLSRTVASFREEFFIGAYRRECEAKNLDACVLLVLRSDRVLGPPRSEYAAAACERSPAACHIAQGQDVSLASRACSGGVIDSCDSALPAPVELSPAAMRAACLSGTHSACATLIEEHAKPAGLGDDVLRVACGLEIGAGCGALAARRLAVASTNAEKIAAVTAFQVACDLHDAASCLKVARFRLKLRRETEKTVERLRAQCVEAVEGTCALLGETMREGRYVKTDAELAFWAYERSCLQTSVLSSCSIAMQLVEEGRVSGGPQIIRRVAERAALIFSENARQLILQPSRRPPAGNSETGSGAAEVQRQLNLAQKSRVLGCRGGDGAACLEVAREMGDEGTERSLTSARRFARSACRAVESSSDGCALEATLLSTGVGGPVDIEGAAAATRLQCERGGSCAAYSKTLERMGELGAAFATALIDCERRKPCDHAVSLAPKVKRALTDVELVALATYVEPAAIAKLALRRPNAKWRDLLVTRCTTRVTSEDDRAVCDAARSLVRRIPIGPQTLQRRTLERVDGALCLKRDVRACKRVNVTRASARP